MRERIQQLVASGQTEQAIDELIKAGVGDAALLSARYQQGKRQNSMGLISFSDWNMLQSQINYGVLELAGKVSSSASAGTTSTGTTTTTVATPTPTPTAPARPKVFISYNHNDALSMRAVKAHLEDNGIQVFVDIQDMGVGDNIAAFIDRALAENQFILSLISQNSLKSGWVNTEFSGALLLNRFGKKWLPALLDKSAFDDKFIKKTQDEFDKKTAALGKSISEAVQKGRDIRQYTDELARLTDLKNDFIKNIQAIKNNLSVDVSGPMFDVGMGRIVKTIHETR